MPKSLIYEYYNGNLSECLKNYSKEELMNIIRNTKFDQKDESIRNILGSIYYILDEIDIEKPKSIHR